MASQFPPLARQQGPNIRRPWTFASLKSAKTKGFCAQLGRKSGFPQCFPQVWKSWGTNRNPSYGGLTPRRLKRAM